MLGTVAFFLAASIQTEPPVRLELIRTYKDFEPRIFGFGSQPDRIYVQNFVFLTPGRWFREVLEIDPEREDPIRIDLSLTSNHMIGKDVDQSPVYLDSYSAIGGTTGKNGVIASQTLGRTIFVSNLLSQNASAKYWSLSLPLTSTVWDYYSAGLLAVVGNTPNTYHGITYPGGEVYNSYDQEWVSPRWDGRLYLYKLAEKGELSRQEFEISDRVQGEVKAMAFLNRDELLVSTNLELEKEFLEGVMPKSNERRIYVLDLKADKVSLVQRMTDNRFEGRMGLSANGKYLAYCQDSKTLDLYRVVR